MADPGSTRPGEWLRGDGPDSDIVISSRIRLARNVIGFPLRARLTVETATGRVEAVEMRVLPVVGEAEGSLE